MWLDIPDQFDYQVSSLGRIRRKGGVLVYSDGTSKMICCKMKDTYVSGKGVCCVSINNRTYRVHQLVAKAFIPNPEGSRFVIHLDGNLQNNCVSNLKWASRSSTTKPHHSNLGTRIVCLDTGVVYPSIKAASDDLSIDYNKLRDAVGCRRPICGKMFTRTKQPITFQF